MKGGDFFNVNACALRASANLHRQGKGQRCNHGEGPKLQDAGNDEAMDQQESRPGQYGRSGEKVLGSRQDGQADRFGLERTAILGLLEKSSKGVLKVANITTVYGAGGLGKSSLLAGAPKPYVLDYEEGTKNLDVTRSPKEAADNYQNSLALLEEIASADKFPHGALGLDGLDTLESLMHKKICADYKVKSMADVKDGYNNGYKIAQERWFELFVLLRKIRDKHGIPIFLIAHEAVTTFNDPTTTKGYDMFRIKLYEDGKISAAKLVYDLSDVVLFAKKKVLETGNKRRAIDANVGVHVMYTQGRAAFHAKNRASLPYELPLRYEALAEALAHGPRTAAEIKEAITLLCEEIEPVTVYGKHDGETLVKLIRENVEQCDDDVIDLAGVEERIRVILGDVEKTTAA